MNIKRSTGVGLLLFVLTSAGAAGAKPSIYGFSLPSWSKDSYAGADARKSLADMAGTGAKWVSIVPTWYMKDSGSSAFVATEQTATDESVRQIIRSARSLGMQVVLKPHVNSLDDAIRPKDRRAWFRSYGELILRYARMAEEENVALLVIGTELNSMTGPQDVGEWESLIRGVRAVYHGKLTFATHFFDFFGIQFWNQLDFVGIDAYFPMPGGTNRGALTLSWRLLYLPVLRLAARAYGKPILFTEFGIASQKGANARPWDYHDFGPVDMETQKVYFEAFLDVFKDEPYFAGFLQWCWSVNPNEGGPNDRSMTVQGKSAAEVLKAYFKELNAAAPPVRDAALDGAARSRMDEAARRARRVMSAAGE